MRTLLLPGLLCLCACSLSPDLPQQAPPLRDVEEPLELLAEPADEAARAQLPPGSFSGLVIEDARETLADKLGAPGPLRIVQVVENSPAAFAGLQADDLLLEARLGDGPPLPLARPADWRRIELGNPPGTPVRLVVDRAGREATATLQLVARARAADRQPAARFREEARVGVVVRTATEVEARAAGLPPGAGAVVVGLSRGSPWRQAGLRFGDLLVAVDGRPLAHPQDLLDALRDPATVRLQLDYVRDGVRTTVAAPTSARAQEVQDVGIPLVFSYTNERGAAEWSCLLGLLHYRSTAAAWRFRLLWLFSFGAGDADRLLEVDR